MNKPNQGRTIIQDSSSELRIEISGKRNWLIIAIFAIWLVGWVIGELYVLGLATGIIVQELEEGLNGVFIFFWLLTWTLGGIYFLRIWLYMTFGKELLTMSQGKLRISKKYALFDKPQSYSLPLVRNFSVNPNYRKDPLALRQFQTWSLSAEGIIKFDYGPKTIFLGGDLDKSEANSLVNLMKEKSVW